MKGNKLFLFSLCLISQLILAECKRNRKWNVGGKSKKWNFGGKNEEQIKKAYYCTRTNLFDSKHSPKQIGGLEGIGSLFKFMGNPQLKIPTIHITGTNGKGSTVRKLAASFMESGYRVGEYMSPYLFTVRENIQINLKLIPIKDFITYHQKCANANSDRRKHGRKNIRNPCSDGYLFCIAINYFVAMKVDIAIIEVGTKKIYFTANNTIAAGGYKDHTNCLLPEVSIITNVQIDHVKTLGDTKEKIMYQKSGIIKKERPVVLGYDMPLDIAIQEAKKKNSSYYVIYPDNLNNFTFDHLNAKVTRKVLSLLLPKYPLLTEEAITEGVKAKLPSRLEEVTPEILHKLALKWSLPKLPYKVFHEFKTNFGTLTRIFKELRQGYPDKKLRVVMTGHRKIMVAERLKALFANSDYLHLVEANIKATLRFKEHNLEGLINETNFDATKFELYDAKSIGGPMNIEKITKHAFELSSGNMEDEIILLLGFDEVALRILGYKVQEEINPKRIPSKSECISMGIRLIP